MQWLKLRFARLRRRREDGGVTSVVAIVFAGGLVMGMLALSIDVGSIMFERRQLQNGADATAFALAQACSKTPVGGECASASAASSTLASLADANALDKAEGLPAAGICGNGVSTLPACSAAGSFSDIAQCTPKPSWVKGTTPYVETRAVTRASGGSNVLSSYFARTFLGVDDHGYKACARVAWGPEGSSGASVPLVLAQCNWQKATSANTPPFAPSPPYSPAPGTSSTPLPAAVAPYVTQIFGPLNGSEKNDALVAKFGCAGDLSNPSGAYAPGGFGWVDTTGGSCQAFFLDSGTLSSSTGTLPTDCKGNLKDYVGKEVDIPVITGVSGSGTGAVYTVDGISSFFFAGYYNVPAASPADYNVYANSPCIGYKSACVWGWFTSPIKPVGSISSGGTTPRGPFVITAAG